MTTIAERFRLPSIAIGDVPPDELEARLVQLVEAAYMGDRNPSWNLDKALDDWIAAALDDSWARWPCDDDDCPARPAWDVALSEAWEALSGDLRRRVERTVIRAMVKALVAFAAAHPEARLSLPAPDAP